MRASASSLLILLFGLACAGCYTFEEGRALVAAAERGELRAIHEVGETGDPVVPASQSQPPAMADAYAALRKNLGAEDAFVRLHALEALRRLSTRSRSFMRDRFPDLFDAPLADPVADIRWRAAWAMGRVELSTPALRQAALDPDPRVAERAVWALGRARDEGAAPFLLRALDRAELQRPAIRSLQRVTGMKLGDDPEEWLRSAAEAGIQPVPQPGGAPDEKEKD